jgi:hypothetical protein
MARATFAPNAGAAAVPDATVLRAPAGGARRLCATLICSALLAGGTAEATSVLAGLDEGKRTAGQREQHPLPGAEVAKRTQVALPSGVAV